MFNTIEKNAESLIIEKKSKFIGNVFYVESTREAEEIIEKIRKKYYDARHNTFAYRVLEGERAVERQSDDGEPSGTAGAPILNILTKKELNNVLIVVTRYFGGILLGTGGLVKAYSEAAIQAIENAKEVKKESGYILEVTVEYENQREFEYILEKNSINIISKEYSEKIKNLIEISVEKYMKLFQKNDENGLHRLPNLIKQNKYINKSN